MSYGVIRKIDKLGKIEIPVNIRRALDIEAGAMMNITKDGETILLNRCENNCVICGRGEFLYDFRRKKLCKYCIAMINEMFNIDID